jgi:hypothetical protein
MWRQIRRRRRIYPPPRDDTYNVPEEEAAEFIGMSHRKLAALRRAGNGPFHVILSGRIRYSIRDLISFCERYTGSKPPPPSYDDDA